MQPQWLKWYNANLNNTSKTNLINTLQSPFHEVKFLPVEFDMQTSFMDDPQKFTNLDQHHPKNLTKCRPMLFKISENSSTTFTGSNPAHRQADGRIN